MLLRLRLLLLTIGCRSASSEHLQDAVKAHGVWCKSNKQQVVPGSRYVNGFRHGGPVTSFTIPPAWPWMGGVCVCVGGGGGGGL